MGVEKISVVNSFVYMNFFRSSISLKRKFSSDIIVNHLKGSESGISVVSLNRPKARNAIGKTLLTKLKQTISDIELDKNSRIIILKSNVKGVFCAGADLKERSKMNNTEVMDFVNSLRSVFTDWQNLEKPTIASIDGMALGGGLELAMACDLRVGSKKAILGLPETSLGVIPGAGGTQRLAQLVGVSKAKELIFTARKLNVQKSYSLGLLNEYTLEESSFLQALNLAKEILPKAPIALKMAKFAIDKGSNSISENFGMNVEQLCYAQIVPTKDRLEGIKAFKEKRLPNFIGE